MKGSEFAGTWLEGLVQAGWETACFLSSNLPQVGPSRDFLGLQMPTLLPACVAASLLILLPPTPQPPRSLQLPSSQDVTSWAVTLVMALGLPSKDWASAMLF